MVWEVGTSKFIIIIIIFVYLRLSNATIHTAAAQLTHEFHRTAKHSVQSSLWYRVQVIRTTTTTTTTATTTRVVVVVVVVVARNGLLSCLLDLRRRKIWQAYWNNR